MKSLNSIILIDDDVASNFLSKRIITDIKIASQTRTFDNGKEALDFIVDNCGTQHKNPEICPELILLDIYMPLMNGFQFLDELENHSLLPKEKMKIFILTSSNNPADIETAKQFPIDGYINKPINKQKLERLLG